MRKHGDDSLIVILALDEQVITFFRVNPITNTRVVTLTELESSFPELVTTKSTRTDMEYYFTCTPFIIRYCMQYITEQDGTAIYLDSDLFFFDTPDLVLSEMGTASVGIIEHKYNQRLEKKLEKYGKFNVGWLGFRKNKNGLEVLDWYQKSTIEWCYDKPLQGKYADQGYLNWFPTFEGVKVLTPLGFNLAPWNTNNYKYKLINKSVQVNSDPLVFFHFHGLRKNKKRYFSSQLMYRAPIGRLLRDNVYVPYISKLEINEATTELVLGQNSTLKVRGHGKMKIFFRLYKKLMGLTSIILGQSIKID